MARRAPPVPSVTLIQPDMAEYDEDGAILTPAPLQREVFDPATMRSSLRALIKDPRYWAIQNNFRDRQQYGRIAYETAYQHEIVGAAFDARLAIYTSKKPLFKACGRDPSETAKDMAAFANHLIENMDWAKFIDGVVGQGLEFGFSLTEIVTKYGTWKGNNAILLDCLYPLPQASLDHGFIPRDDYGSSYLSADGRYRCFEFDEKGRITAYVQYAFSGNTDIEQRWAGTDRQRILHYVHKGGDGNPWGQSALFHTMPAFLKMFAIESMEDAFLDTSLPWLFGTYKTTAGETRAKVHEGAKEALSKAHIDAARRFLMWGDGDLKSVAPSNENFTDHVFRKKAELEARIWQTLNFPKSLIAETTANEADSRNLVQVYFKHTMKATLEEIGLLLGDLVERLLRSNFSNIQADDIPLCTWSTVTENEIRVAQGLLPSIIPHVKSKDMPEFIHSIFDFIDPNFIADKHEESVAVMRPAPEPEQDTPSQPPTKQPGSQRQRNDSTTENAGGVTKTSL